MLLDLILSFSISDLRGSEGRAQSSRSRVYGDDRNLEFRV